MLLAEHRQHLKFLAALNGRELAGDEPEAHYASADQLAAYFQARAKHGQ